MSRNVVVQRRMDTTEWLGVVRGGMPRQGTIVTQTILGPRRRASDTTLAGDVKMSINSRCLDFRFIGIVVTAAVAVFYCGCDGRLTLFK